MIQLETAAGAAIKNFSGAVGTFLSLCPSSIHHISQVAPLISLPLPLAFTYSNPPPLTAGLQPLSYKHVWYLTSLM